MSVINQTCYKCGGTGVWIKTAVGGDTPIDPCPVCLGSGKYRIYTLDLPEHVFEAYQVLEATAPAEYDALTGAQKAGYALLLSCGKVDLGAGKVGRTRLLAWFGAESQTVANLTELIGG